MSPFQIILAFGQQKYETNAKSSFEWLTGKRHRGRLPRSLFELEVKWSRGKLRYTDNFTEIFLLIIGRMRIRCVPGPFSRVRRGLGTRRLYLSPISFNHFTNDQANAIQHCSKPHCPHVTTYHSIPSKEGICQPSTYWKK